MALVLLGATLAAGCTKNETIEPDTNQEGSLKIVATIEQPKTKSFLSGTTVVEGETEFTQDWIGNETIFIFNAAAEPTSTDTGAGYIYAKHSGMVGYSGSSTLVFDSIQKTSGFSFGSAGSERKLFATVLFTGSSFTPSMKTYQNTIFGVWGSSDNRDGLVKRLICRKLTQLMSHTFWLHKAMERATQLQALSNTTICSKRTAI